MGPAGNHHAPLRVRLAEGDVALFGETPVLRGGADVAGATGGKRDFAGR
jgi:hypothetical protein